MKTVPPPGRLEADTVPPCRSTMAFTIDSPSPLPDACPARDGSTLKKRSNTCGRCSGAIPEPVSLTVTTTSAIVDRRVQVNTAASGRVAQRVGGKILKRLLEPHRIAGDDLRACADAGRNLDPLLLRRAAVARDDAPEQIFEGNVLRVEGLAASLEPRQIEQVADDVLDARGFVADDRKIALTRFGCERLRVK